MKAKLLGIAFADAHFNLWKDNYNYKGNRLVYSVRALELIADVARAKEVPLLFAGDLIHTPKHIDNEVLEKTIDAYNRSVSGTMIAISGNHDQSKPNTIKKPSPSYIKTLSKILPDLNCIDGKIYTYSVNGITVKVYGIPYLTHNKGFDECLAIFIKKRKADKSHSFHILMVHRDLPGAKNGFGFEIGESSDMDKSNIEEKLKDFDLVLSGHIHKPQQLGRNIFMLGSPSHQNSGDMGIDMGYWEIYNNQKPLFVKLPLPEYKPIKPGKEPPDDFHIYVPIQKAKQATAVNPTGSFNNKTSKVRIAKNYMKVKKVKDKKKRNALVRALVEERYDNI